VTSVHLSMYNIQAIADLRGQCSWRFCGLHAPLEWPNSAKPLTMLVSNLDRLLQATRDSQRSKGWLGSCCSFWVNHTGCFCFLLRYRYMVRRPAVSEFCHPASSIRSAATPMSGSPKQQHPSDSRHVILRGESISGHRLT